MLSNDSKPKTNWEDIINSFLKDDFENLSQKDKQFYAVEAAHMVYKDFSKKKGENDDMFSKGSDFEIVLETLMKKECTQENKFLFNSFIEGFLECYSNESRDSVANHIFSVFREEFGEDQNQEWFKHLKSWHPNWRAPEEKNLPEFPLAPDELNKYENPSDESSYFMFSMVEKVENIEFILSNFVQHGDQKKVKPSTGTKIEHGPYQSSISGTLAWSGSKGNNVRIEPWEGHQVGFIMDPDKIDVPYADFKANRSFGFIPVEGHIFKKPDSKYQGKEQVNRPWNKQEGGVTNQAVLDKLPVTEEGEKSAQIAEKGDISIFAKNVWRKYFKNKLTSTNEALCIQSGDENPVMGIFLDVASLDPTREAKSISITQEEVRGNLVKILRENPALKLYIYDRRQEEHVLRVVENERATELLSGEDVMKNFSKESVSSEMPYKHSPQEKSHSYKDQQKEREREAEKAELLKRQQAEKEEEVNKKPRKYIRAAVSTVVANTNKSVEKGI